MGVAKMGRQTAMERANRLLEIVSRAERLLVSISFAVMTIIIMADVLLREISGTGIAGAPRVAVYAMIITTMISFGLASQSGRHLRPKFADSWVPKRWEPLIERLQEWLTAAFCLTFAVVATGVVAETWALGETSRMLRIPIWPMQSVIPLAFFVAALRHAIFGFYPALKPRAEAAGKTERADQ